MSNNSDSALRADELASLRHDIAAIAQDQLSTTKRLLAIEDVTEGFRREFKDYATSQIAWTRHVIDALESHMEREEKVLSKQATDTAYQIRELALMDHGDIRLEIRNLDEKVCQIQEKQKRMVGLNHTFIWASVIAASSLLIGLATRHLLVVL